MTEKLRSGANGKVRGAIQQSIARILVGAHGTVTVETRPDGLLDLEGNLARLDGQEGPTVFEQGIVSPGGRSGRVMCKTS